MLKKRSYRENWEESQIKSLILSGKRFDIESLLWRVPKEGLD
jgi:hypothetical protein